MIKELYAAYYISLVSYFKWIKDKDAEFSGLIAVTFTVVANALSVVLIFSTESFLKGTIYYYLASFVIALFVINYNILYKRSASLFTSENRFSESRSMRWVFAFITIGTIFILFYTALCVRERILGE